jgi:hypothetical protein
MRNELALQQLAEVVALGDIVFGYENRHLRFPIHRALRC